MNLVLRVSIRDTQIEQTVNWLRHTYPNFTLLRLLLLPVSLQNLRLTFSSLVLFIVFSVFFGGIKIINLLNTDDGFTDETLKMPSDRERERQKCEFCMHGTCTHSEYSVQLWINNNPETKTEKEYAKEVKEKLFRIVFIMCVSWVVLWFCLCMVGMCLFVLAHTHTRNG